jgi:RND family efflux transporter MFP subunit
MKALLRRLIFFAALIAVAGALYYFGGKYLWPAPNSGIIQTVGIIEAPEVNISSRIGGRIASLKLVEGDLIEQGQVVCVIEDVDIRNQLAQARANLLMAQADADNAQRTMKRDQELFVRGVIAAQTRDDQLNQLEKDRAAVAAAKAAVQLYQDQLNDTQIRAPMSGVVVSKNLEVGEWVNPGTAILTVDDLSTIWARVDLEETQLGFIRVGTPGQVTLPTQPPTVISGEVMAIGQEGQFATETDVRRGRQDIRTFYVKVRLLQPGGIAKPGMTAEVTFRRPDAVQFSGNTSARAD